MLCFTLQRYKIESNSQHPEQTNNIFNGCVSHCKDTKLKAIHNQRGDLRINALLCFTLQRYKIESNSQHRGKLGLTIISCVSHCKDTKLKAIHNYREVCPIQADVVFHTAKIQN